MCGSLVLLFSLFMKIVSILNNVNKTFIDVFVSFFDVYKEKNNCLISFLSFSEIFLAFN